MPIVADIHFHYKRAIGSAAAGARVYALILEISVIMKKLKRLLKPQRLWMSIRME